MHVRLAAATLVVLLVSAGATAAQTPSSPPDRSFPDKPLIAQPPAKTETDVPPVKIPMATNDSITSTENAVLAAHDNIIAALEELDFDRLSLALLPTNRGAMIADGRLALTQDDVIGRTRREFADISRVRYAYSRRHVTLLSSTSAMVVGDGKVTATRHDGTTFSHRFAQTVVFMRVGETWKIVHMHSSTPLATLGD